MEVHCQPAYAVCLPYLDECLPTTHTTVGFASYQTLPPVLQEKKICQSPPSVRGVRWCFSSGLAALFQLAA